jgi:hypothetical protein
MRLSKADLSWIFPSVLLVVGLVVAQALWPDNARQIRAATIALMVLVALVLVALFVRSMYRPRNYRSLRIREDQFEYENSLRHRHVVRWSEIASVTFIREEEALPDDLAGPFLITKWEVLTTSGAKVEVMDERSNRADMLKALRRRLPGFSVAEANRALPLSEKGAWLCFERMSDSASPPTLGAGG